MGLSPELMAPRAQRLRATPEATLEDARRPLGLSESQTESEDEDHESQSESEDEVHEPQPESEDEVHESQSESEDEVHESQSESEDEVHEFLNECGEVDEEIRALRR